MRILTKISNLLNELKQIEHNQYVQCPQQNQVVHKIEIDVDYKKLASSIVSALEEKDRLNEKMNVNEKNKMTEQESAYWQELFMQKTCRSKNWVVMLLYCIRNFFCGIVGFVGLNPEKETQIGTYGVMKAFSFVVILVCQAFLTSLWIAIAYATLFDEMFSSLPIVTKIVLGMVCFVIFIIERAINIVRKETNRSTDKEFINNVFNSVIGVISMLFAVIAVVVAVWFGNMQSCSCG